jgi:signal transduction histidine kinase
MKANQEDIQQRLHTSVENAREAVERAKQRARGAISRAAQIREAVNRARAERPEIWEAGRKTLALYQLAVEESVRSAHEKDKFLAIVSHELRQPLNAARAAVELLDRSRSEADAARARAVLRRQVDYMCRLVDDLLDLSRAAIEASAAHKARIDLRRAIESAAEMSAAMIAAKRIQFTLSLPDEPLIVSGEESRLVQAFGNLLSNAVRYTPDQGRVDLRASTEDGEITIDVSDTGRGIDADDLARVFEPFTRGRSPDSEGLGVGLALVRGIVERHGGSVAAESAGPNSGSRFTVKLPSSAE